jgi:YidC/Oxa1 family membrane protein insertase
VSPFAGILPVLAQAPVLTLVYALFASPQIAGAPNVLLDGALFGAPLGRHLTALAAGVSPSDLVFVGLLVALVAVAWLSRRVALRAAVPAASGAAAPLAGLGRILSFAPFLTVVFATFLPLAATLYLTVSGAWSLGERTVLRRVMANAA